jgi:hypothetical protein
MAVERAQSSSSALDKSHFLFEHAGLWINVENYAPRGELDRVATHANAMQAAE